MDPVDLEAISYQIEKRLNYVEVIEEVLPGLFDATPPGDDDDPDGTVWRLPDGRKISVDAVVTITVQELS